MDIQILRFVVLGLFQGLDVQGHMDIKHPTQAHIV